MAMACGHLGCQRRSLHIKASSWILVTQETRLHKYSLGTVCGTVISQGQPPAFFVVLLLRFKNGNVGETHLRHGVGRVWSFPSA